MTGKFLKHPLLHPVQPRRPVPRGSDCIEVQKAKLHNLRNTEAALVLTAAGDLEGAAMAIAGPVEGRDP